MNKIHAILEGLVNEAVNTSILDRFIQYCRKANAKNIGYIKEGNRYFIYGISDKRFKDLVKSFIKACEKNNEHIVFDYDLSGTTEVLKLETLMK